MWERSSKMQVRNDEESRDWVGDTGRHLPVCPAVLNGECEPAVCRLKEFQCQRCRQWRSWCFGHSESDECINCADALDEKILAFVKSSKWGWRRETEIIRHLLGRSSFSEKEPTLSVSRVEDMLFELIQDRQLKWMEPEREGHEGDEDLRYQIEEGTPDVVRRKNLGRLHVPRPRVRTRAPRKRRSCADKPNQQPA